MWLHGVFQSWWMKIRHSNSLEVIYRAILRFWGGSLQTSQSQLMVPVKEMEQREKSFKILEKLQEHSTNEKKKKQTIPVHTACWQKAMTKSGPTRYLEYHRSYPIPTYFVTKGLLHWGQKCHLLLRSQINFKIPNKTTHDRNLKCL